MESTSEQGAHSFQRRDQSGLIGSASRPQLPFSTVSPGPDAAALVQGESVIQSARDTKHGRDVLDSLKLRFITRRAPQFASVVVSRREDASLRVDDHHTSREGSQASKRPFRELFHLDKSRLEGAVGVAEAQLPFSIVAPFAPCGTQALHNANRCKSCLPSLPKKPPSFMIL